MTDVFPAPPPPHAPTVVPRSILTWSARTAVAGRAPDPPKLAELDRTAAAALIGEAARHSMLPLLWHTLRDHSGLLPPGLADELRLAFDANARRNLLLAGELLAVLRTLETLGIEAVSWKGPVLAQRAYRDLSLRQFYDLDILVRRADLARARAALLDLGFGPEKRMTPAQEAKYVERQGELELVRRSDDLWVELHTAIVPTYYARGTASEELWSRLVPTRLARSVVRALDPVDEVRRCASTGPSTVGIGCSGWSTWR